MKKTNSFGLIGIIVIIIITALVSSITTGVIMLNNSSINLPNDKINISNDKNLKEFIELYETLLTKYYDKIDKEEIIQAAKEGMVNYLGDDYTTYLKDSEYENMINELSGTYNGIGVAINGNLIVKVIPNTPAERAGLQPNDVIIKVNDQIVEGMNTSQIVKMIKDESTSEVNLEIKRNEQILKFTIKKETLENITISYEKIKNTSIGYISLQNFSENLDKQVLKALNELENEGISSLIIDVRDNVGGYLSAAEQTASLFLEKGKTIYSLETSETKYSYADKTDKKTTYPIIVLMNGNSASASEILAAALKDSYGATLVGTNSYGKGKVQQVISLDDSNPVKVSTAKWLRPTGVCIDGVGLTPDYNINFTGINGIDEQLEKAIELLSY